MNRRTLIKLALAGAVSAVANLSPLSRITSVEETASVRSMTDSEVLKFFPPGTTITKHGTAIIGPAFMVHGDGKDDGMTGVLIKDFKFDTPVGAQFMLRFDDAGEVATHFIDNTVIINDPDLFERAAAALTEADLSRKR